MAGGFLGSLAFLAWGVVSYTGVWKGWITVGRGFGSTIGFASLWLGLAFAVGTIGLLVSPYSRLAFFMLAGVAAALLVVALVGFFWLPAFLLPRWYRVLRGDNPTSGRGRA